MNNYLLAHNQLIKESIPPFLVTEQYMFNELKVKCIMFGEQASDEIISESAKLAYELYNEGWGTDILKSMIPQTAGEWGHTAAYVAGAIDPTGVIDAVHAIQLFSTGHPILGSISLIGCLPYVGDTAKLLIPAIKSGKPLTGTTIKIAEKLVTKLPSLRGPLTKLITKISGSRMAPKFLKGVKPDVFANKVINTSLDAIQKILTKTGKMANHINFNVPKLAKFNAAGNVYRSGGIFKTGLAATDAAFMGQMAAKDPNIPEVDAEYSDEAPEETQSEFQYNYKYF